MNPETIFRSGAFLTGLGMSFGAFGSHGLRARTPAMPQKSLDSWSTAASYLIYNGLALLAVGSSPAIAARKNARLGTAMIVGGGLVFSGTVFGLVLAREKVGKVFGPMTPLGGMVMIGGYIALAL